MGASGISGFWTAEAAMDFKRSTLVICLLVGKPDLDSNSAECVCGTSKSSTPVTVALSLPEQEFHMAVILPDFVFAVVFVILVGLPKPVGDI